MRNLDKQGTLLERAESAGLTIEVLQLDVTDATSISTAIETVMERAGRIDVLLNNAGAGFAKTTEQATEAEMQWVTDVNYFGVVRCTKAVLPIMRTQKSGRVINITSVGGLVGQPFNEFYCAAKFAVEGYTEAMASYLTDHFGIHFSLVEPGGIVSEFMASAMAKTVEEGKMGHPDYLHILQKYMSGVQARAASGEEQTYQTAAQVADVVLQVAQSEQPPLRVRTSEWAEHFCNYKTQADPDGTLLVNALKEKFLPQG